MNLSEFDKEWDSIINGVEIPPKHDNRTQNKKESRTSQYQSDEEESDSHGDSTFSEDDNESDNHNKAVLETISSTFNTLILQVDELRQKYKKESEQRKKIELANQKLTLQVASLEDENAEMHEALKHKAVADRRGSVAAGSSNRRNKRLNMPVDARKSPEQNLQLALMGGGDDDDIGLGIQENAKTHSALRQAAQMIFRMMPFEKDIRVVQASFGGAVAAYFSFFRWM